MLTISVRASGRTSTSVLSATLFADSALAVTVAATGAGFGCTGALAVTGASTPGSGASGPSCRRGARVETVVSSGGGGISLVLDSDACGALAQPASQLARARVVSVSPALADDFIGSCSSSL